MRDKNKWRGYTLDQLDTQRAMVKLKIALETERVKQTFSNNASCSTTISSFSRYVSLGRQFVKGVSAIKNFISIIRSFRNKR